MISVYLEHKKTYSPDAERGAGLRLCLSLDLPAPSSTPATVSDHHEPLVGFDPSGFVSNKPSCGGGWGQVIHSFVCLLMYNLVHSRTHSTMIQQIFNESLYMPCGMSGPERYTKVKSQSLVSKSLSFY